MTYAIGDIFILKGTATESGELAMLVQVAPSRLKLVSLKSGNRLNDEELVMKVGVTQFAITPEQRTQRSNRTWVPVQGMSELELSVWVTRNRR